MNAQGRARQSQWPDGPGQHKLVGGPLEMTARGPMGPPQTFVFTGIAKELRSFYMLGHLLFASDQ